MYVVLRIRWCKIIVLNALASTEDTSGASKKRFSEELEQAFDQFPGYHKNTLFGDFKEKLPTESIFEYTNVRESLHENGNDNCVRVVRFPTRKF